MEQPANVPSESSPANPAADLSTRLHSASPDAYGAEYAAHRFEQYKLYVEMADRISTRRQTANSFFLSINTALLAFLGVYAQISRSSKAPLPWVTAVALAGIVLCYYWYRLVRSYKDLNSGKFNVIHAIEAELPLAPYAAEWKALGEGRDPSLYLPFTEVEVRIPWVFAALYAGVAIWKVIDSLT